MQAKQALPALLVLLAPLALLALLAPRVLPVPPEMPPWSALKISPVRSAITILQSSPERCLPGKNPYMEAAPQLLMLAAVHPAQDVTRERRSVLWSQQVRVQVMLNQ